eukprot:3214708-Karenia_brevis.AAC.1
MPQDVNDMTEAAAETGEPSMPARPKARPPSKVPCRLFAVGKSNFGDSCWFRHQAHPSGTEYIDKADDD